MKLEKGPIFGYKATDENMRCRGVQFILDKWYMATGPLKLCENGFHFCEHPSGPWAYYSNKSTRIFKIEAKGVLLSVGPGSDLKHVARKIRLIEEIATTGDGNTGHGNTGDGNTGDGNTGDRNTGDGNTGDGNTGDRNTGYRNTGDGNTGHGNTGDGNTGGGNTGHGNTGHRNTGDGNTGDRNTGHGNTGDGNTGDGNTGYRNTGDGNTGDYHSGCLCFGVAPFFIFNAPANRADVDFYLVSQLADELMSDKPFDCSRYLELPNASEKIIKTLHKEHIKARRVLRRAE